MSAESNPVTIYEPPSGWQLLNVRELWKFRELLWFFAWRDVKVRYKQTALGAVWAILQPFMMMVVFTIFFNRVAGIQTGDTPYPIFVYSGLVLWQLFASSLTSASNSVVGNGSIITKVYFPRLIVPVSAMGTALVDFLMACGMLGVLMLWFKVDVTWGILFIPIPLLLCIITATGFGCLVAALNVSYRDFRYTVPFVIQLWLFATPTVYMMLPQHSTLSNTSDPVAIVKTAIVHFNPMTAIVSSFRAALLGQPVSWAMILNAAALSIATLLIGLVVFRRFECRFADIV
jgi:lipopolysaccharide transport system permease protein